MWDNRLIGLDFIFSLFIHIVISDEEAVIKWIRPHWLTSHRVFGYQAVRHIRFCPACPKSIHPLRPRLVEGIETVQLTVVNRSATALVLRGFVHMDRYSKNGLLIKPPVLQVSGLIQGLQIHRFFIQI